MLKYFSIFLFGVIIGIVITQAISFNNLRIQKDFIDSCNTLQKGSDNFYTLELKLNSINYIFICKNEETNK